MPTNPKQQPPRGATSRYSGTRRALAPLRVLALNDTPSTVASTPEVSTGRGSGGGAPTGKTSRYSGARRLPPTLHILSLFEAPFNPPAVSPQNDPLPILFL